MDNAEGVREAQGEVRTCQGEDRASTPPREPPPRILYGHMGTFHTDLFIHSFIYSFSLRVIVLAFSLQT
jgi:hypothetical protein